MFDDLLSIDGIERAGTPAKRGEGSKRKAPDEAQDQTPAERRAAMTWAQRLKRVFNIDPNAARSRPAGNAGVL